MRSELEQAVPCLEGLECQNGSWRTWNMARVSNLLDTDVGAF